MLSKQSMKRIFFFITAIFVTIWISSFSSKRNPSSSIYSRQNIKSNIPNPAGYDPLEEEQVWLGRLLFYDRILSGNNKQSCSDCHKQELAFTDGYKLAIGSKGD